MDTPQLRYPHLPATHLQNLDSGMVTDFDTVVRSGKDIRELLVYLQDPAFVATLTLAAEKPHQVEAIKLAVDQILGDPHLKDFVQSATNEAYPDPTTLLTVRQAFAFRVLAPYLQQLTESYTLCPTIGTWETQVVQPSVELYIACVQKGVLPLRSPGNDVDDDMLPIIRPRA